MESSQIQKLIKKYKTELLHDTQENSTMHGNIQKETQHSIWFISSPTNRALLNVLLLANTEF